MQQDSAAEQSEIAIIVDDSSSPLPPHPRGDHQVKQESTEDVSGRTHLDLSIQIPLRPVPFVSGHCSKTSLKSTSSFKSGTTSYSPRGILRNLSLQKKVIAHPESERSSLLSPSPMETAKTPSTAGSSWCAR
ncbi:hypothetical protein F2Q68_00002680 [Brassica cretica]|uniref:Uncharacterized protein n=1 Tax=Brassica cretica TaxID=69181 RepID=A0A8S9J918_BRACR|nr:hypothetical protein F2Q68_00002680 [Brassica cretica]